MSAGSASRVISGLAILTASGVAAMFGLHLARSSAREEIYRDRLQQVVGDYRSLRDQYNEAVRQTTLTELVVENGELSVRVRTAEGSIAKLDTPYDPSGEIYVDYAMLEGRVWIRRVFDANTPPSQGVIVDPRLASIDWDASGAMLGKAVYRSLDEGRWVVSVTGNGSLGLTQAPDDQPVVLSPPPDMGDFGELETNLDESLDAVGFAQVWSKVIGG